MSCILHYDDSLAESKSTGADDDDYWRTQLALMCVPVHAVTLLHDDNVNINSNRSFGQIWSRTWNVSPFVCRSLLLSSARARVVPLFLFYLMVAHMQLLPLKRPAVVIVLITINVVFHKKKENKKIFANERRCVFSSPCLTFFFLSSFSPFR